LFQSSLVGQHLLGKARHITLSEGAPPPPSHGFIQFLSDVGVMLPEASFPPPQPSFENDLCPPCSLQRPSLMPPERFSGSIILSLQFLWTRFWPPGRDLLHLLRDPQYLYRSTRTLMLFPGPPYSVKVRSLLPTPRQKPPAGGRTIRCSSIRILFHRRIKCPL